MPADEWRAAPRGRRRASRRRAGTGRPRPYDTERCAACRPPASSWPRTGAGWPEHLGRRAADAASAAILDVRWRPDGSGARGPRAAATSPAPSTSTGATDLVEPDEDGEPLLLAGPDRVAAVAEPRRASATARRVVLYDDTPSLFAARAWWSLRVYGSSRCRILDGGFRAWAAERAGRSRTPQLPPAAGHVHAARPSRDCA